MTPAGTTPEVAELLAAVVDALEVPLPASWEAQEEFSRLLDRRRTAVHVVLSDIVRTGQITSYDADAVRKRTELSPVTYEPYRSV